MAKWALISGERREGRDDVVRRMVGNFKAAGFSVGGCTQVALPGPDGPIGYDAKCFDGRTLPVARPSHSPTLCGFSFSDETFAAVRADLKAQTPDITVLPGAKLESAGEGHWPAMQDVLAAESGFLVLVLRPHIMSRVIMRLDDPIAGLELPNDDTRIREFEAIVLAATREQRGR